MLLFRLLAVDDFAISSVLAALLVSVLDGRGDGCGLTDVDCLFSLSRLLYRVCPLLSFLTDLPESSGLPTDHKDHRARTRYASWVL